MLSSVQPIQRTLGEHVLTRNYLITIEPVINLERAS
jgi:hypothetical protein